MGRGGGGGGGGGFCPVDYYSEGRSITGVIRRTTISVKSAPFEVFFFSLSSPSRRKRIQINILLVMNIQYTHPPSNEKTGTT